jgi:hypothetical protein
MTTLACLAAFFGASACWGVIGFVLGRKYESNRIRSIRNITVTIPDGPRPDWELFKCGGGKLVLSDPDAELDREIGR